MEMKKFLLISLSVALILGLTQSFEFHKRELETEDSLWDLYERWRSHHTVSTSLDDKNRRFNVFKANVQHVHNTNNKTKPYKLKLNKFADMTNHEFRSFYAGSKIKHYRMLRGDKLASQTFMYENVHSFPLSMDWRTKGAVTPVKDQGQCGKHRPSLTKLTLKCIFRLFLIRVTLTLTRAIRASLIIQGFIRKNTVDIKF